MYRHSSSSERSSNLEDEKNSSEFFEFRLVQKNQEEKTRGVFDFRNSIAIPERAGR